jgi:hypothetical protein
MRGCRGGAGGRPKTRADSQYGDDAAYQADKQRPTIQSEQPAQPGSDACEHIWQGDFIRVHGATISKIARMSVATSRPACRRQSSAGTMSITVELPRVGPVDNILAADGRVGTEKLRQVVPPPGVSRMTSLKLSCPS